MRRPVALVFGLATLLSGRVATAQTCTAASSGLSFSAYDQFSPTPSSIAGTVSVTCRTIGPVAVAYSIQLDGGTGGSIASRAMSGGTSRLGYQLYTNPAHSTIWGNGSGGTGVVSDSYMLAALGTLAKNYTAYGLVPARQIATPGLYTDLMTILVTY